MMKLRLLFLLLFFGASIGICRAQVTYKQALGTASISFPSRPSEKKDEDLSLFSLPGDSATYAAMIVKQAYTYRKYIDTLYKTLQANVQATVPNCKMVYSKKIKINDFNAVEFKYIDNRDASKPLYVYQRAVCVDENMYSFTFSTPYDDVKKLTTARNNFFASFVIR